MANITIYPLIGTVYEYNVLYSNVNMKRINRRDKNDVLMFENMTGTFIPNPDYQGDNFVRDFETHKVEYTMENTAYKFVIVPNDKN